MSQRLRGRDPKLGAPHLVAAREPPPRAGNKKIRRDIGRLLTCAYRERDDRAKRGTSS
jgi:hypothetical protein